MHIVALQTVSATDMTERVGKSGNQLHLEETLCHQVLVVKA